MELQGTAAIVTGAASGLGAATARALAAAGARVTLIDRDGDMAQDVANDFGGRVHAIDVADSGAVEAALASAAAAFGPARILVNCAGVATPGRIVGRDGPLPLAEFERVVRINLIGTFNVMRVAAAAMATLAPNAEGERGVIINTASVAAIEGQDGQAAYAASKGGVAAMTLPAARELARFGIRVMTIAPGIFGTQMLFGMSEAVQDSLAASIPFPSRLGRPEEFAQLVLHILANPMLNGEVIRLDGAIRLGPR